MNLYPACAVLTITASIVLGPIAHKPLGSHLNARAHGHPHAAPDTVDIAVGSPLVSGDDMAEYNTHIRIMPSNAPAGSAGQEWMNRISHADSAGRKMIRADSKSAAFSYSLLFDRHTLKSLTTQRGAAPPQADSAFMGNWADFIVERLPRRTDVVYRVPMFKPSGAGMAIERHLYQTMRREDVEVLGHKVNGWVVEDHSADGKTLLGRMWITKAAPYLVRWTMYQPNGVSVQIDQELAK